MILPASIARHLITTVPTPAGWLSRFHYFDTPQPPAVVQAMHKAGYTVRRMQVDGQQQELCIWYQEAA